MSNFGQPIARYRMILLASCSLALADFVYAQSFNEKTGINSTLGISPSTQDFVTQAVMGDLLEIESSKLAEERGDAKTKQFASKMVKDHSEMSAELKALLQREKINVALPANLDKVHQSKMDKLKGLNGSDFAKEYDDMQIGAHKDAVSLFGRYSGDGDNPNLKAFAIKHLPRLEEHLRIAQDLKK